MATPRGPRNTPARDTPAKNASGVLQVPVSLTKKPQSNSQPAQLSPAKPAARLRVLVRRLPPGLTKQEFESCLGQEWKLGGGNVDWSDYKGGKVSKE